jgi:4-amino-4-deoxy-L-arabinose transferase-like glycosyltransferase
MTGAALRTHVTWSCLLIVAVTTYLYSLDGLYIPHIGDEAPYIQIVRRTAESGRWLPLRTPPGLENTKPPLLFWLGIVSTDWARAWSLFRLRSPITLFTFTTAGLVFLLALRIARDREPGYLAALSFLAFASTYQYGRPFLTNLPETLFVFLPFFLLLFFHDRIESWGIHYWIGAGLSVGLACLFKSFVLVVPVGVAFSGCLLSERRWRFQTFLARDAWNVAAMLLVALACFSLWPLLDPDPASVIRQFVVEENLGKLAGTDYLRGLFVGPYPLHRIWLGPFANAGPLALPILYLTVSHWKRRHTLSLEEKFLWIFVLSFLLVYSIPSQRQENYLLPTAPALAVLLGGEWKRIQQPWFYVFALPLLLGLLILIWLTGAISSQALPSGSYQDWQRALPWVAIAVLVGGLPFRRAAPFIFHLGVLLALASLAAALAPFEGPAGRYNRQTQTALAGAVVHVPSNFVAKYERHRFILPESEIEGYDPSDRQRVNQLLRSGQIVAIERPLGQTVPGPFDVYGRRLTLRSRQRRDEMVRILFDRELDLLVQQEFIVQRRSP